MTNTSLVGSKSPEFVAKAAKLREETGVPMMECKKFLFTHDGDYELAKAALLRGDWKFGKLITYARPGWGRSGTTAAETPAEPPTLLATQAASETYDGSETSV